MPDELLPSDAAVHRISVRCPAKVNLGLEVLARRADGYHELCTVLQAIDLYDELTVEAAIGPGTLGGQMDADGRGGIHASRNPAATEGRPTEEAGRSAGPTGEIDAPALNVEGPFAAEVPAEGNTVLTAWAVGGGVRLPQLDVRLLKRIPSGAGLGGGSSNAAAMLLALREIARLSAADSLDDDALAAAALRIGSDVPFFLQGGCALATGRGEELTPLTRRLPLHIALLVPRFDSPTGAAYAALGRGSGTMTPLVVPQLARALEHGDWGAARPGLINDFAGYLLARHPQAREWIAELERCGALAATFTGSGSGLIGVFDAEAPCAAAVAALSATDDFRYCGAHRAIG